MLKGKLIHPDIISSLAHCGHGDKVLIADGNYPLESRTGGAVLVHLGVMPGIPSVTDVLEAIQSVVNIEKAEVMAPSEGNMPEIFDEFTAILDGMQLDTLDRYGFYKACEENTVRLAISTGEERVYANILITIGVA